MRFAPNTLQTAVDIILEHDGGTFKLSGGANGVELIPANHSTGYYVSLAGLERRVDLLTTASIKSYISTRDDVLKTAPGLYIGVWFYEGQWYLDVACHTEDESAAIAYAQEQAQVAVWDCADNVALFIVNDLHTGKEYLSSIAI